MCESKPAEVLGVGVVGLHEGRTLLKGLNNPIPSIVGSFIEEGQRATYAKGVAGCDLEPAKRERVNADIPGLFLTDDYDAMLARPEVDIVAIYTPDDYHGEHIVKALEAGKHVICTKPVVNSMADARRVLEASRATGKRLQVGQSTRFFESFKRQRADFEAGALGRLECIDAHYNHRMDWFYEKSPWSTTQSDWVFLGMSHPLDLLRWYLGPIKSVYARSRRSALATKYELVGKDIYMVTVEAQDGRIGRAMGHYGYHELPSARNAIECLLFGDEGTSLAQYHDMRYYRTAHPVLDGQRCIQGAEVKEDFLYARRGYYFNNDVHGMHFGEFANYADYFAESIVKNTPNSPDAAEGIETFCLMEAVKRSAEGEGVVELAPLMAEAGL